ncbi:hypothetical protein B0T18DRAFT_430321 [Schizothecium vesticola]|uniref:Hydrophobin n=1 Tax=Schizothecium vesticola TaxID=314040 RepID=A0AA40EP79_9PEZI|nr:hypothetical protein B0T18DRAFT_430321 [Schizothecium vesticola]
MLLPKAFLLAALLALTHAFPLDTSTSIPDLKPVLAEPIPSANSTLTWYQLATPDTIPNPPNLNLPRDPGCGSTQYKCSPLSTYDPTTCSTLAGSLDARLIHIGYRAVCLNRGNGQCCISLSQNTSRQIRQN